MGTPKKTTQQPTSSLLGKIRHTSRNRRGQSMVEFALMAPLLFLLLLGIVDFGRALFYENEITNAAREGARIAILASNPCNTVVGNGPGCTTTAGVTGVSVCQAIQSEGQLISTFNGCSDSAGSQAAVPPCTSSCSANAGQAYVEIDEFTAAGATCSSASTNTTRSTPRIGGNVPMKVTIVYYYRPLTPLMQRFFPDNFYLTSSTCVRSEY